MEWIKELSMLFAILAITVSWAFLTMAAFSIHFVFGFLLSLIFIATIHSMFFDA